MASSTEVKVKESLQVLKAATKQNRKVAEEKNVEPQEKVCCPADGCSWFTDLSKNRVALLYHALEDHYGEVEPLELAFRVGKGRCSVCMRVPWSFEHFQHHVERHRLVPRHPCLHQGCTARFKSGIEMRRHARKHSPLQAVCCLPGCSKLFICLWALNLHEKEHYAFRSPKPDTNTNMQTSDKHNTTPFGKKRHQSSNDSHAVNKTESVKAAWKLREPTTRNSQLGKHPKAPPLSTGTESLIKQELKERHKSKDSNVLKNLSNKDTSKKPTGPNLRLRQTLRKEQVPNATLAPPKIHKVISSSLLKHSSKLRQKLKKKEGKVNTKGLKRKGRPPKSNNAADDENATETVKGRTTLQKNQRSPAQSSPTETVENATASTGLKVEEEKSGQVHDVAKTTTDKSKSKSSASKRNHVKQKGISHHSASSNSLKQSNSELKTQKLNAVKMKKSHKTETRSAPSDSSKSEKPKTANGKVDKKATKKIHPTQEADVPSASSKPAASTSAVQQVEAKAEAVEGSAEDEGKVKVENTDSTQNSSELSIPASSSNVPAATESMQKVKKEEKSKKLHVTEKGKSASSNSGKAIKKQKDAHEKGDKKSVKQKRPRKDEGKASGSKKRQKCDVQQQSEAEGAAALVKNSLSEDGEGQMEAPDSSGPSMPAVTNTVKDETCPITDTQKVVKKEKSKKTNVTKKTDPSKANKKRKDVQKDDGAKTVKKQCKDGSIPSASKKPEVQPLIEDKAEAGESSEGVKTAAVTPPTTPSGPGYSLIMNGKASSDDGKSAVHETLAKYSKKPYMRLPPTAYLDEKYITMPKRRKEMVFFLPSQRSAAPEEASVAAAALQRQRCANCFATFNSAEELQGHLQLQKCTNLFGFDSDDEGNS